MEYLERIETTITPLDWSIGSVIYMTGNSIVKTNGQGATAFLLFVLGMKE